MKQLQRYLAVDIGGTAVKYSILNESYEELECGEEATQKDPKCFLDQLFAISDRYSGQIAGMAVCMAGFIDPVTGENRDFSVGDNFRAWNLKKELSERTKIPIILENDSNCAALGEMVAGAGKGLQNFVILTIGTGVGAALVFDGKLVRGSHFKAGEAGLALIGENDSAAGYVTAEATSRLVREVSKQTGNQVDGHYVFEHLDNPEIQAIYKKWLERIVLTAGNLAVFVDPEAVLIGGGICRQEHFISDFRQQFYALFPHMKEYTRLEACQTGNLAGRIGALYLLLNALKR